jgi:glucosamine-6-phosphate deaminase
MRDSIQDQENTVKSVIYDKMPVGIYDTNEELGIAVAKDVAEVLRKTLASQDECSIIVATGNSQLSFMKAIVKEPGIAWNRVSVFHMDEYLGMHDDHSASFRKYIREKMTDIVHPKAFYGVNGDAPDVKAEMARYTQLLNQLKPVACVLGIGENGHLAFNDPPADFHTAESIHIVALADTARRQQVGEGHFATLADVPTHALSLTVPALIKPAHVFAAVPEARKAEAVKASLEGPVTPDCPASLLRTLSNTRLYLDRESASLLA